MKRKDWCICLLCFFVCFRFQPLIFFYCISNTAPLMSRKTTPFAIVLICFMFAFNIDCCHYSSNLQHCPTRINYKYFIFASTVNHTWWKPYPLIMMDVCFMQLKYYLIWTWLFFFFVFKHIYIFYVLQIHSIGRYEGYRWILYSSCLLFKLL